MAVLNIEGVRRLANHDSAHAISIFVPTHRAGEETREDPIRLKNQLDIAQRYLQDRGIRGPDVRELLEPATRLVSDSGFWRHQSDGLALFLDSDHREVRRLPCPFEDMTVVGEHFHVTPLLNAVNGASEFYVLALSRNHVRLLHGSRDSIAELDLPAAPDGVDALFFDKNTADQLQLHTVGRGGGSEHAAVFHGQGGTEGPWDERVRNYLRLVVEDVSALLRGKKAPLIFAGDRGLYSLYEDVNSYKAFFGKFVAGNPDHMSPDELHQQAWTLVKPSFDEAREEQIAQVNEALGKGMGSTRIEKILNDACDGKVERLLIADRKHVWGRFRTDDRVVESHSERQTDCEDLLNLAAIHTLRRDGIVMSLPQSLMPNEGVVAAVYRF